MAIKMLSVIHFPDRMIIAPGGVILFVEVKRPGETPRAGQRAMHRRLQKLGFTVLVVDSKEGVDEVLHRIEQSV